MSYEVLYRKWRPQSFRDVAGQGQVTMTLRNAVKTNHVSHAYLFAGPRGTGKTSTGRILAKAINCAAPVDGEPCNECQSCQDYSSNRALDLVEMDAASNRGIEDIRDLRDRIGIAPGSSRFRVYLIDEAHQLTSAAFNALLKTLEEPPPHAVFILATTEAHDVPATIASRCQRFDFRRITAAAVIERLREIALAEGIETDDDALGLIARQATGSLRDAVNLLDQIATQSGRQVTNETVQQVLGLGGDARTRELARRLIDGDLGGAFQIVGTVRDDGVEMRRFHRELLAYLRGLLVVKAGAGDTLGLGADDRSEATALVADVPTEELLKILRALSTVDFRGDVQSSLPLELAIAGSILAPEVPAGARAQPSGRAERPVDRPMPTRPQPTPLSPRGAPPSPQPPRAAPPAGPASVEPTPISEAAAVSRETPPPVSLIEGIPGDFIRQLYQVARKTNPKNAAFVNGTCDVTAWEAPVLTLGVFDTHKFILEKLAVPEVKQLFEAAAAEILGVPVQIVCALIERRARERPAPPVGDGRGGHLVEAARQMGAQTIGPK